MNFFCPCSCEFPRGFRCKFPNSFSLRVLGGFLESQGGAIQVRVDSAGGSGGVMRVIRLLLCFVTVLCV